MDGDSSCHSSRGKPTPAPDHPGLLPVDASSGELPCSLHFISLERKGVGDREILLSRLPAQHGAGEGAQSHNPEIIT